MKIVTHTPGAPSATDIAYTAGLVLALGASSTFHCALIVKLWKLGFLSHADVVDLLDGIGDRAAAIDDQLPEHTELREAILELLALCRRSLLGDGPPSSPGSIIGGESAWPGSAP